MRKKGIWLKIVKIQENNLGLEIVAVAMKSKILKRTAGGAATDIRASEAVIAVLAETVATMAQVVNEAEIATKVRTDQSLTSKRPEPTSRG